MIRRTGLVVATVGLIAILASTTGYADTTREFDTLIREARQALQTGNGIVAAQKAQQAIALKPNDPLAYALLTAILTRRGLLEDALAANQRAEALTTDPAQKSQLQRDRRSIEDKRRAVELATEGVGALQANQFARGAAALTEAYRLAPEIEAAGLQAAQAWWRIDEYAAAAELLRRLSKARDREVREQAVAFLAENAPVIQKQYDAEMSSARQAMQAGRLDQSVAHAAKAARYGPEKPEPLVFRAEVLTLAGKKEEAVQALDHAIRLGYFDRNALINGPAFRPLVAVPAYRTLVGNVLGTAAVAALDVKAQLDAASRERLLADRMAVLEKLRQEFPDRADVRDAVERAQSEARNLQSEIGAANSIQDPETRASRLRALAARYRAEPAVESALRVAAASEAEHKANRERIEEMKRKREACESQQGEWKFSVANTTDFDLGLNINGKLHALSSGTWTDLEYASKPRLVGDTCTQIEPPVVRFPIKQDGTLGPPMTPVSGRRYQLVHDKERVSQRTVDSANPVRSFGALALEPNSQVRYQAVMRALSYRSAQEGVLKRCSPEPCKLVHVFWDACVSVWRGADGFSSFEASYAHRPSKPLAEEAARSTCRDRALRDCTITLSFCADGS